MNVSVIVPAKDEEKNIGKVIEGIKASCKDCELIVVDDGSEDRTSEVAESLGCRVLRLEENHGKGFACRLGAENASSQKIVFIDADGQFYSEEIPKLAEKLNECDIAIGSRDWEAVPIQRRLSNRFSRFLVNSATKSRYRDVLCGFRAVRRDSFIKLGLGKNRYEFEVEMLIKAHKKGLRVCEVPVRVRYLDYPGMPISQSIKLALFIITQRLSFEKKVVSPPSNK